ncbi:MAG: hypothetical protein CL581_03130 [Alteromonadaceae bacterium]|nr:hypothetical protein [Alteromonadaceae bacterium]MBH86571.1 hypothetical protein [Alteromonadaceae bacterium]|tara:strand:+ start:22104 stop:23048 length:945 start_codon:yes stop_codon:yes gene_type:complete
MSHIPVGISSCLLGQSVRHDGGHKHSRFCTGVLAEHFSFQPLCPELEAGLGVPRPTIHIRDIDGDLRLVESKGSADHTDAMRSWIKQRIPDIDQLRGYILMAKSPSCGMERIKVHNAEGRVIHREGRGLFAEALIQAYPLMPVEEEGRLNDSHLCENFIERVFAYDDWMNLVESGLTPSALVDFHTRHKFQLMAHCNQTHQQLGRMIANLKSAPIGEIGNEYIALFMAAMKKHIRRGAHANVMQHMMGFLRQALSSSDRQMMTEQIDAYRREEVPLVVPMTLLMMAQRRAPADYLSRQEYLSPYPEQLGLRNKV